MGSDDHRRSLAEEKGRESDSDRAASITGHSKQVYDAHYAKPFRDAEERDECASR